ncbi:MAG: putative metal-binding motif-containing protein [Deltaproteobacteria bacterium]|nr:putative metal-binding motif-containing protein [Deltaproteobacteria bacterium]
MSVWGCGDDSPTLTGEPCESDSECGDDLYCNGDDICLNGFCATLPAPTCDDGIECTADSCSEALRECVSRAPDADGDGSLDARCLGADGLPLGRDCDDSSPNRYPGNPEVCDEANIDEDCDPTTFGSVDDDGDGLFDAECCNFNGVNTICGNDCDDSNYSIQTGSQVCSGGVNSPAEVSICQPNGLYTVTACDEGELCVVQPSGTGVCDPL